MSHVISRVVLVASLLSQTFASGKGGGKGRITSFTQTLEACQSEIQAGCTLETDVTALIDYLSGMQDEQQPQGPQSAVTLAISETTQCLQTIAPTVGSACYAILEARPGQIRPGQTRKETPASALRVPVNHELRENAAWGRSSRANAEMDELLGTVLACQFQIESGCTLPVEFAVFVGSLTTLINDPADQGASAFVRYAMPEMGHCLKQLVSKRGACSNALEARAAKPPPPAPKADKPVGKAPPKSAQKDLAGLVTALEMCQAEIAISCVMDFQTTALIDSFTHMLETGIRPQSQDKQLLRAAVSQANLCVASLEPAAGSVCCSILGGCAATSFAEAETMNHKNSVKIDTEEAIGRQKGKGKGKGR